MRNIQAARRDIRRQSLCTYSSIVGLSGGVALDLVRVWAARRAAIEEPLRAAPLRRGLTNACLLDALSAGTRPPHLSVR
jgi:hypothetical protein